MKAQKIRVGVIVAGIAVFCFGTAFADVPLTPPYTEPVLEISVPSGSTNLVDWLTAEGKTLSGQATLKKTGAGKLVVTASIAGSFSGDVVIVGGILSVSTTGMLGADNSGVVYVLDGAQLLAATAADVDCAFNKKTFVIAGNGVNNGGAIRKTGNWYGPTFLGDVHLAADARYEATANLTRIGAIYLHGHDLTASAAADFQQKALHGPGRVIQSSGPFMPYWETTFDEAAPGSLLVQANGQLKMWGCGGYTGGISWPIVFESGAAFYVGDGFSSSTSINALKNPVELLGQLRMTRYNKPVSGALTGYVTGVGPISSTVTDLRLYLTCPTNDFTGGIQFTGNGDSVYAANGALPRAGGTVSVKNGAVHLMSGSSYSLPPLEIVGTGLVSSAGAGIVSNGAPYYGTWRQSVVKKDEGVLEYKTLVGGELLDVQGGTVRFSALNNPGLYAGYTNFANQTERNTALAGRTLWVTGISDRVDMVCHAASYWQKAKDTPTYPNTGLFTYSGYLWNRASTNEVWSFCEQFEQDGRVYIDDELFIKQVSYNTPVFTNRVMTPGPHRFEVRLSTGNGWIGSSTWNGWDTSKGLGVCKWGCEPPVKDGSGKYNLSNYSSLVDPGDGSLFSVGTNDVILSGLPSFDTVRAAPGTTLDLSGRTLTVPTFEGASTVTNGNLNGLGRWNLTVAAVQSGPLVVDGSVTFAADAVVEVTDFTSFPRGTQTYEILRASSPIVNPPKLAETLAKKYWSLKTSADGRSLYLYHGAGLLLIFR